MGCLKMLTGNDREARELFQESISIARLIKDRWRLARGLEELGVCFQRQSKPNEAAAALESACSLWDELSNQRGSRRVASTLAGLKSSQVDWDGALSWYDHLIAMCRSPQDRWELADHLERKGGILMIVQRYDEAALHFEAAIVASRETGDLWDWPRTRLCIIPKTAMKWERRSPLYCDLKKLQRRQPQLATASLKLPIPVRYGES